MLLLSTRLEHEQCIVLNTLHDELYGLAQSPESWDPEDPNADSWGQDMLKSEAKAIAQARAGKPFR